MKCSKCGSEDFDQVGWDDYGDTIHEYIECIKCGKEYTKICTTTEKIVEGLE